MGTEILSRRQGEVLALSAEGKSAGEIAALLGLRISTVRLHLGKCREKLNARNTTAACSAAVALGLIRLEMSQDGR